MQAKVYSWVVVHHVLYIMSSSIHSFLQTNSRNERKLNQNVSHTYHLSLKYR